MTDLSYYKLDHYQQAYERELQFVAVRALLEIGIAAGGSHQAWKRRYPLATIIGIDVDPRCAGLIRYEPDIKVHLGDASNGTFLSGVIPWTGLDVIIDDGSHWPHHQRKTLAGGLCDGLEEYL